VDLGFAALVIKSPSAAHGEAKPAPHAMGFPWPTDAVRRWIRN
jgi:hypothetical protein